MLEINLETILEKGFEICKGRRRIYKSGEGTGAIYRMLCFDMNNNLKHYEEQNFKTAEKCVNAFLEACDIVHPSSNRKSTDGY